jgi:proton-dependent oligopeptide transporter, POT family
MTNNLTSQAATMKLNGVPNDLIQNINPLSLIIFIPICDQLLYPYLRKANIRFTAIKRIFLGFMFGVCAMIVSTVIQYYVYKSGPKACYKQLNTCSDILEKLGDKTTKPYSPINVWVQIPAYVFIAFSEIFASITGLEYAFTKAPQNMRSLVMSLYLFTSAVSAALGQAFLPLADDPYLVWNYASVAIIAFVMGLAFWFSHRNLDAQDDALNNLPGGTVRENRTDVETHGHQGDQAAKLI